MSEEEELPLSWFHFKVNGAIQAFYKTKKILLSEVKYNVMYEGDLNVVTIELIATFDTRSLQVLKEVEPMIKGALEINKNTFQLKMKNEILKKYNNDFIKALSATELMSVGESVCLKLDNFIFEKALEKVVI